MYYKDDDPSIYILLFVLLSMLFVILMESLNAL